MNKLEAAQSKAHDLKIPDEITRGKTDAEIGLIIRKWLEELAKDPTRARATAVSLGIRKEDLWRRRCKAICEKIKGKLEERYAAPPDPERPQPRQP